MHPILIASKKSQDSEQRKYILIKLDMNCENETVADVDNAKIKSRVEE